jgi:Cu2+-exporting ATPase
VQFRRGQHQVCGNPVHRSTFLWQVCYRTHPSSSLASIQLARKVRGKIKQNLFWAVIYNLIAIPIAAGTLYPSFGLLLRPEWSALAMNASTVTVTLNALLLNRARLRRRINAG